jgi:hypothetical protein
LFWGNQRKDEGKTMTRMMVRENWREGWSFEAEGRPQVVEEVKERFAEAVV